MALWRTRTLTAYQKEQIAEEQEVQEEMSMAADHGSVPNFEDAKLSKVYNAELPISVQGLMEMFDGGKLEHKVMEKSGCHNYITTPWDPVKPGVCERHLSYRFNRHVSIFGGEVTCTQQKSPLASGEGWIVNEVMSLHDVPFDDHFRVHFRYEIEKSPLAHNACKYAIYIGISWLKSTKFQQRITQNITEKFTHRLKEMIELVEREILFATQQDTSV